jgi:hypothetical protein
LAEIAAIAGRTTAVRPGGLVSSQRHAPDLPIRNIFAPAAFLFAFVLRGFSALRHPEKGTAMRHILMGTFILILGGVALAQDRTSSQYCDPWCARDTEDGGSDCSYHTFQQCLATAAGTGHCYENPLLYQCRRPSPANSSARRRR